MSSPTQRTLKVLRDEGWLVAVVEKWNNHVNQRIDLFGFIDIIAIRENETLAVQATSYSHSSDRKKKIISHMNYKLVKQAKWRVEVWAWQKVMKTSKKGTKYIRYVPKITAL